MFRKLAILLRSIHVMWRFPLRSALTILSAILGVAGALASINYALRGTQKSKRSTGEARNQCPHRYTAPKPQHRRQSANGRSRHNPDPGRLRFTAIGVEPDYLSIKEWTVRKGELFAAGDERHMARVVLLGASAARDLLAQWAAQPRVFDQASAWLAVGVATVLNSGFAAIPARGVARLDPIQALRFE